MQKLHLSNKVYADPRGVSGMKYRLSQDMLEEMIYDRDLRDLAYILYGKPDRKEKKQNGIQSKQDTGKNSIAPALYSGNQRGSRSDCEKSRH